MPLPQTLTGVDVEWDNNKPDGQLVRFYNLDKLKSIGFEPAVDLKKGVELTYEWYAKNFGTARK